MRCSTPITLVSENGRSARCPSRIMKKGNQYMRKPITNMSSVRLNILSRKAEFVMAASLSAEKLMAFPTAKRKEGNTRSVGVNPCHAACEKGPKGVAPLPGELTIIIKHIVMPRNTSSARKRLDALIVFRIKRLLKYRVAASSKNFMNVVIFNQ